MASKVSYTLTLSNNKSEKEALEFLLKSDSKYLCPDRRSRLLILEILGIEKKYFRAFDLVIISGCTNLEKIIELKSIHDIVLVELKTTKKLLLELPKGFFFGATESEFALAEKLGEQYKFCFVSLHPESKKYTLLSLSELNKIIKSKRVQYQINL
jgi:hypothetical protein